MTTERRTRLSLAVVAALALVFVVASCRTGRSTLRGGLPKARVEAYPAHVKKAYDLFAVRCSRCHTLSRPLNAAIYDYAHWETYVARMRRHAGSGISPADAEQILVFLKYYADENAVKAGLRPATTSTSGDAP